MERNVKFYVQHRQGSRYYIMERETERGVNDRPLVVADVKLSKDKASYDLVWNIRDYTYTPHEELIISDLVNGLLRKPTVAQNAS